MMGYRIRTRAVPCMFCGESVIVDRVNRWTSHPDCRRTAYRQAQRASWRRSQAKRMAKRRAARELASPENPAAIEARFIAAQRLIRAAHWHVDGWAGWASALAPVVGGGWHD